MIGLERFEGEHLDYRPNWTDLPCPDCGRMPVSIMFDYDDDSAVVIDERLFSVCWVRENEAYIHIDTQSTDQMDGCGLRCPTCYFEPSSTDELETASRGIHADQIGYICPECDTEDWGQSWSLCWEEKYY